MASAHQDFLVWLAQYEAKKLIERDHGKDAPGSIFTEPVARSFSATSSLRRGFNGKKPRTSAPEITGVCTVTTRNGDKYTIGRRGRVAGSVTLRTRLAQIDSKLLASNHAPSNDGNPNT